MTDLWQHLNTNMNEMFDDEDFSSDILFEEGQDEIDEFIEKQSREIDSVSDSSHNYYK